MRPRHLPAPAIVPAFCLLLQAVAAAGPIYTINNDAKGGVDQLATVTWTFQGAAETGLAGTLVTTLPGGQKVDTYCIDLFDTTYVGNGGSTWSAEVLPISAFGTRPYGTHWGEVGYLYAKYDAAVANRIDGAALQVAIWKAEYDGNGDFASGSFRLADCSDARSDQHLVFARAGQYLAGIDATRSDGGETFFRATSHPNALYQDLVGPGLASPSGIGVFAVPEPASILMIACGLGPVLVARAWFVRRG